MIYSILINIVFLFLKIEFLLYKSSGNKYQLLPFKSKRQNFCEYVNNSTDYDYIRTRSNIPAKGVCPWPKVSLNTQ